MSSINRGLLIAKPKQPLFDWLKTLPDQIEPIGTDQAELDDSNAIDHDHTAYLVPEFEDDEEQRQVLEEFYSYIFEEELASWNPQESDWPKNRDLTMFLEWFDVEFHSVVYDLAEGLPLTDLPYGEDPDDYEFD